jgi:hypothetical protein
MKLVLLGMLLIVGFSMTANAQSEPLEFDDPDGFFRVSLPPGWVPITNTDPSGKQQLELIVFRVRENGALKIRRVTVDKSVDTTEFAKKDENERLRFLLAYDPVSVEKFAANGPATLVSYNFNNAAGQKMTGRNYYVRANETTVFILNFTGGRNTLGVIRNQTDFIARSLKGK